jgi:hypothetical protein
MTGAWTPAVVVAFVTLLGIMIQQWRQRPVLRDQVKADLEIWSALPEESSVRKGLLKSIDSRVQRILKDEDELARDPSGIALGTLITGFGGWLVWWIWTLGGAYRLLELVAVPLLIVGIFGVVDSATRAKRDEGGRRQRRQSQTQSASQKGNGNLP